MDEELFTFGNTKRICIDAAKLDALSQATRRAKEKEKSKERATTVRNSAKESSDESSDMDGGGCVAAVDSPPSSPPLYPPSPLLYPPSPPLQPPSTPPRSQPHSLCIPSTSAQKKSLPVLLKADALISMLRSPTVSCKRDDDSHLDTVGSDNTFQQVPAGSEQPFNLRVRLRGQIHKYSVTQDMSLLEVCALLASDIGCDPRQVFLSHGTSTLDLLSSVVNSSLTTVDIVDAVITDTIPEPQKDELVICEVEDEQNPICLFSIRSSSTSVDYSINKSEPISKAMCAFANSIGTPLSKVRFTFDGCPLDPEKSVLDLGLENGDIIDAEVGDKRMGTRRFSLPCIHLPSLLSREALDAVECLQTRRELAFSLLNQFGVPKPLREIFRMAGCSGSDQVTGFVDYLTVPGSAPVQCYEWLWLSDHGQYSRYDPEVCAVLTREFQASPGGRVTVTINAKHFVIDFAAMLQIGVETGTQRAVRCSDLVPCWYYGADNGGTCPFSLDDAGTLEDAFGRYQQHQQAGPERVHLTILGRKCSVDFAQLRSEDLVSHASLQLERRSLPRRDAVSCDSDLMLEVCGVEANMDEAFQEVRGLLEARLVTLVVGKELQPLAGPALQQTVKMWASQHFVRAAILDGKVSLTGARGYVENLATKVEQQMALLAGSSSKYPSWWDPQMTKIELKVVPPTTPEWVKVVSLVHQTLGHAQVTRLERVQNQWLWDRYVFAKQRMAEKNGGEVNEKELFHGTRVTCPEKIYRSEQGFDFRYSAMGNWGTGTYFAVNASYSHSYSYAMKEGEEVLHQMFLACVLTGVSYYSPPDPNLKKPPVRPSGPFEDQLYDSVRGNTGDTDVYVIYDHEKAYPAYLLTYSLGACTSCRGRRGGRRGRGRPRKK